MTAEHQAQGRHQQQRLDPRIRRSPQVGTIGDQNPLGLAGIGVQRPLPTVTLQTFQVRLRAGQDQCGLATGRVADHTHLRAIDVRRQKGIAQAGSDRRADLQGTSVEVAQGPQAAMVAGIVARMGHGDDDEAATCQGGRQVMQGQGRTGVAVGKHQQRIAAHDHRCAFPGLDPIAVDTAAAFGAAGRIERQCLHRLRIQRVGKAQPVHADTPVRSRLGVHRQWAAQQHKQE
ncbi:hypothetical protein D3C76_948380 [compost metagenome]